MKTWLIIWLVGFSPFAIAADAKLLYENKFEQAEIGNVPDDMLVLEGGFGVKEENGAKFLELPGAPLDTFGVLFGPTEASGLAVQARVLGTGKGRRYPTFGVGLNGVGGYRLRVSPAKKLLELYKGDDVLTSVPYAWESGAWTLVRLQARKMAGGGVKIEGKAWKEGAAEPAGWTIDHSDEAGAPAGRASLWGCPYSGTPIRFDDLKVTQAAE